MVGDRPSPLQAWEILDKVWCMVQKDPGSVEVLLRFRCFLPTVEKV